MEDWRLSFQVQASQLINQKKSWNSADTVEKQFVTLKNFVCEAELEYELEETKLSSTQTQLSSNKQPNSKLAEPWWLLATWNKTQTVGLMLKTDIDKLITELWNVKVSVYIWAFPSPL